MEPKLRSHIIYLITQGLFFLLLLAVFAGILLGFVPIKHQLFARRAAALLRANGIDSCSVAAVEITAWRSITIQGLYCKTSVDSSESCTFRSAKVVLPINILQYYLNKKRIIAIAHSDSGISPKQLISHPGILARRVLSLCTVFSNGLNGSFSDVWMTVQKKGKTVFLGTGGQIELSPLEDNNDELLLDARFPIINALGDGMQNVKCTAMLTTDGQLSIGDLSAVYFDGHLKAKGSIALFENDLKTSYAVTIEKLDFSYWYAMHCSTGKITGTANIACRGEDIPFNSLDSTFSLSTTIYDCTVYDLPLQQSLATSLFIPSLSSLEFKKLSLRLRKKDRDTIATALSGASDQISFSSNGWELNNGTVQQMVNGVISARMINTFPSDVRKILSAGKNEDWKFSCRLFGTLDDPRFELDRETLQRAVGGFFNNLQQEIYEQLMK